MLEPKRRKIIQWIYQEHGDNIAPVDSLEYFVDKILKVLHEKELPLIVPKEKFEKEMFEYFLITIANELLGTAWLVEGPRWTMNYVNGWCIEFEEYWEQWLNNNFDHYFWDEFWPKYPADWEENYPRWRTAFQTIMYKYIVRRIDKLIEDGYMEYVLTKDINPATGKRIAKLEPVEYKKIMDGNEYLQNYFNDQNINIIN
jgi:hypothetical protein